jgi:protease PrsW
VAESPTSPAAEAPGPGSAGGAPAALTVRQIEHARQRSRWRPLKVASSLLGLAILVFFGLYPVFEVAPGARWLIFVAATLPALVFVFLVVLLDRNEIEPFRAMLGTFLWGALVATLVAGIINSLASDAVGRYASAALVAPLTEETAKGIALLFLYFRLRHEFDNVLDGIVYGALVGIGFAMVENYQYFSEAYQEGGPAALRSSFYIRVVVDGWAHAAYTATTGAALGYARETPHRWLRLVAPVVGWCCAVFQHAAWNGVGAIVLGLAVNAAGGEDLSSGATYVIAPIVNVFFLGPGLAILLVLAWLAWRREAQIIAAQLHDEVAAGVLSAGDYARLCDARRRRRDELGALFRHGPRACGALVSLDQAATDLAFRKWHVSRGERPKRGQAHVSQEDLRHEIAAHRARVATLTAA